MRGTLILMLLACPATAADVFTAPAGCEGTLTVQSKSCQVSHHWVCAADAPGDSWRIVLGPNGPEFLSKIDAETQWLESYDLYGSATDGGEFLVTPADDPASFSELLDTGLDAYDFQQDTPEGRQRVVGFDRIVETGVMIDGEPLLRTEYSLRITGPGGDLVFEGEGSEYASARHGRFFSGYGSGRSDAGSYDFDRSPVDFIYPGEPGFFGKTPLYGCAAEIVRFVPDVKGY